MIRFPLRAHDVHVQIRVLARGARRAERNFALAHRRERRKRHFPAARRLARGIRRPRKREARRRQSKEAVFERVAIALPRLQKHRRVYRLHFQPHRLHGQIVRHHAVHAHELRLIRLRDRLKEVPAVARRVVGAPQRLVLKVPYEPALKTRVFLRQLAEARKPAAAVQNLIRVFAQNHRPVVLRVGKQLQNRLARGIHRAANVRNRAAGVAGLVLNRPRRVVIPQPRRHRRVMRPQPALVAQRPDEDARVILVRLRHAPRALKIRLRPLGIVGQHAPHAVRLKVRLAHDHQPVLVAQVVKRRIVRVVAAAHGVHAQLLHQKDFLFHLLARDRAPAVHRVLVPVHAAHDHAPPVQLQNAVLNRDRAEAEAHLLAVGRVARAGIQKRQMHAVQRGRLRRPKPRMVDFHMKPRMPRHRRVVIQKRRRLRRGRALFPVDDLPVRVVNVQPHQRVGKAGNPRHLTVQHEISVLIRPHHHVLDVHARLGIQRHRTEHARKMPVILILQPRRVREPHHLKRDLILARVYIPRHVKLARQLRILRIPHGISVHPYVKPGLHPAEMQNQLAPHKIFRQFKRTPVKPGRNHVRQVRRIHPRRVPRLPLVAGRNQMRARLVRERINPVRVNRLRRALQLPVPRHLNLPPVLVVEIRHIKRRRQHARMLA